MHLDVDARKTMTMASSSPLQQLASTCQNAALMAESEQNIKNSGDWLQRILQREGNIRSSHLDDNRDEVGGHPDLRSTSSAAAVAELLGNIFKSSDTTHVHKSDDLFKSTDSLIFKSQDSYVNKYLKDAEAPYRTSSIMEQTPIVSSSSNIGPCASLFASRDWLPQFASSHVDVDLKEVFHSSDTSRKQLPIPVTITHPPTKQLFQKEESNVKKKTDWEALYESSFPSTHNNTGQRTDWEAKHKSSLYSAQNDIKNEKEPQVSNLFVTQSNNTTKKTDWEAMYDSVLLSAQNNTSTRLDWQDTNKPNLPFAQTSKGKRTDWAALYDSTLSTAVSPLVSNQSERNAAASALTIINSFVPSSSLENPKEPLPAQKQLSNAMTQSLTEGEPDLKSELSRSVNIISKAKESAGIAPKRTGVRSREPSVKVYYEPQDNDVLLGRGGRTNHHPGNKKYLDAKDLIQERYLAASKNDKTDISQELVDTVHEWGGRFLQLDEAVNKWYEVTNIKARKKASQTLREMNTPQQRAAKRAKYGK